MSTKPNAVSKGEPLAPPSCPGMRRSLDRCLALWDEQPLAAMYIAKLAFEDRLHAIFAVLNQRAATPITVPLTLFEKLDAITDWQPNTDTSTFKTALTAISDLEKQILWTQESLDLSQLGQIYDAAVQADTLRKTLKTSSGIPI